MCRWLPPLFLAAAIAIPFCAHADLVPIGAIIRVNSEHLLAAEVFPSVGALTSGEFVVTWSENIELPNRDRPLRAEIMARRFGPDGDPIADEILVNTYTTGWQGWPVVDTWHGGFVIAWESDPLPPDRQFGGVRRYDRSGIALGDESRFAAFANDPVIATDPNGGFAIAWGGNGLETRRFNSAGVALGDALRVADDTPAGFPAIAVLADGSVIVAFETADAIAARRFDETGLAIGASFPISDTPGQEPELTSQPDGGFVAIWTRSQRRVGRRFAANGEPAGSEFLVDERATTDVFPGQRKIASDRDGGFVVVSEAMRCTRRVVTARLFDSLGVAVGSALVLGENEAADHRRPSVAADQAGRYVVAWTEIENYTRFSGSVLAQRLRVEPSDTRSPTVVPATCPPTPTEATITPTPEATPSPTSTVTRCIGDCNGNRQVTIAELIIGVRIALGELRAESCRAFDREDDGRVTVADLVQAVGNALGGCDAAQRQP